MSNKVIVTPNFKKEAKPLLKKYPSLKSELLILEQQLIQHPQTGAPLGNNAYKIRIAVKSKGKGKSGGMRLITYVEVSISAEGDKDIFLLSIYDKSEVSSISKKEIAQLIQERRN
ncbi:MAG TPA: type II toxin-antitoxin system RelE/ParE family toxin [Chitinophagales bacterium]|nr:type II toxin-antitoxin system RelE/ParE family toxin [Chitinophagales bacterium]